jgi:hypothetical protein
VDRCNDLNLYIHFNESAVGYMGSLQGKLGICARAQRTKERYVAFAFPIVKSVYTKYPTEREWTHSVGLRIIVLQSGTIARFSFQTFLLQMTTSLALFAVANFVVDMLGEHKFTTRQLCQSSSMVFLSCFLLCSYHDNEATRVLLQRQV